MLLFTNPRLFAFNVFDIFNGNKKRKQLNDVKTIIDNTSAKYLHYKTNKYLSEVLNHACTTTPFYKKFAGTKNLEDWSVINKNIIKGNFNEFESYTYKNLKKITVKTSGSTGTPFILYQDVNKTNRNEADNLYFSQKAGYTIGNKLYYFRLWNAFHKKSFFAKWAQNIKPIDVFDLNNTYIEKLITDLKKNKSPKSWIGYASAFNQICKYLNNINSEPINCNIKSAIAISESLSPNTKKDLKKFFNVDTVSRYSNVENGIIAQQLPNNSYFEINTASYYVEVLELNSNMPVKLGEKGRIVITDLFNYCMPMIRYDTGDIGCMGHADDKLVLTQIEGRKIDSITNTEGEIISNNLLLLINKYHELNQCQLIQKTRREYVFKINIDGKFKNEKQFINEFKSHLGKNAIININYVKEIPLLASGKRRVMVNEYNKSLM
ncbi:CoF synthetase [Hwangdonia lutea]|uniref:CoF synthetase n=1 Tax=Hwangdonia lutea TaxID=3075823 RepID=A0AA97ENR2_9FLAO|nr:CoF synthetase [Hwangdonia sp. SCSIO 19198]WOD43373.1 CoF synthetase [Hwangdonia sp. SCSIO 19198]